MLSPGWMQLPLPAASRPSASLLAAVAGVIALALLAATVLSESSGFIAITPPATSAALTRPPGDARAPVTQMTSGARVDAEGASSIQVDAEGRVLASASTGVVPPPPNTTPLPLPRP